jgi:hypothetical protein
MSKQLINQLNNSWSVQTRVNSANEKPSQWMHPVLQDQPSYDPQHPKCSYFLSKCRVGFYFNSVT